MNSEAAGRIHYARFLTAGGNHREKHHHDAHGAPCFHTDRPVQETCTVKTPY
jgi:hypothetical protein